jgi:YbbR domain-containing protein
MPKLSRRWKPFWQEKVLSNWRYKLSALAAAFIIWAYVAGQQSMQAVYQVPVYFQNTPTEHVLGNSKIQKIQVTISGRRDRILSLKERQIWVAIDLSGMKSGKNYHKLNKQDIVVPGGIEVKNFTPKKITIRLRKPPKPKEKIKTE